MSLAPAACWHDVEVRQCLQGKTRMGVEEEPMKRVRADLGFGACEVVVPSLSSQQRRAPKKFPRGHRGVERPRAGPRSEGSTATGRGVRPGEQLPSDDAQRPA
ncbi:hypothetical protein NDU88_006244 [Pleurodeles waltl]|uniref:Uncharacterized protein n=1 Tax=Pleurodeles waltl TaxID=8319 RepID=A0AAV7RRI8_PLEWA|nr:hypothetical protein NDU88_006244 [Pleurodeles waltl]